MPGLVPTSWSSSDDAIASVDANGLVSGKAPGTANIAAHYQNLVSNTVVVTVTPDLVPASIVVTPGAVSVVAGQTVQLSAVVNNAAGQPV